jgi:uncharacterized damage-inducible protein DinB
MAIIDVLLPEFEREMGSTRRVLERVPLQEADWRPHPKSRTLLQLATHVADIPMMATRIMTLAQWDGTGPRPDRAPITETAQLLGTFDEHVAAARAALVGKTDGELMAPWTFKYAGREMFTVPRIGAIRTMCLSHGIHHRGQLTVYLRLRDVPLPPIYGPSADETV